MAPSIDASTNGFAGDSPMMRAMMENRAVLRCNEPLTLPGRVNPRQPIIFAEGPGRIHDTRFTPNRVTFGVVTTEEPAKIVFNSKYIDGWKSTYGTLELDPATGLAYLAMPPFTATQVELRFIPEYLVTGLMLLGAGLVMAVGMWRQQRRRAPARTAPLPAASSA